MCTRKGFDNEDSERLVTHNGISQSLINLIKATHEGKECRVLGIKPTDAVSMKTGAQECLLSKWLFMLAAR